MIGLSPGGKLFITKTSGQGYWAVGESSNRGMRTQLNKTEGLGSGFSRLQ